MGHTLHAADDPLSNDEFDGFELRLESDLKAGRILTPKQVSVALGLTTQQITKALQDGKMVGWQLGRAWFTRPEFVEIWRKVVPPRGAPKETKHD